MNDIQAALLSISALLLQRLLKEGFGDYVDLSKAEIEAGQRLRVVVEDLPDGGIRMSLLKP